LERLESVGLYGQQVLKPQKVIRWVTWPIPSVTDIGTSTNAGNGSVTEAGIETVTKGVTGVGTHQNTKKKEKKTYVAFYQFWNSKCSLPTIQSMTPERKKQLDTRMREKLFADNWRVIIDKLSASPFCTGDNGSGWEATVDWLLKNATNYVKVLEGKYDSSSSPQALASIPVVRDAEGLTPRERLIKERGISI
jgi:hypothetical protein